MIANSTRHPVFNLENTCLFMFSRFVTTDPSRLPSGKVLEKFRLDTFSSWPHDASKGHGANSKQVPYHFVPVIRAH
jgi:hypothetical protein